MIKAILNGWRIFWQAAKYFPIDAFLVFICIFVVVYWWINPEIWMEGGVAILFVYANSAPIRLNNRRKIIRDLKAEIDMLNDIILR
jgi:hypothetical protein